MFTTAKEALEAEEGVVVVHGFLSPAPDIYVSRKLGAELALDLPTRLQLLELALADSPGHQEWLSLDEWEGRQEPWADYDVVFDHFVTGAAASLPPDVAARFVPAFTCGADFALSCHLYEGLFGFPVVCVDRATKGRTVDLAAKSDEARMRGGAESLRKLTSGPAANKDEGRAGRTFVFVVCKSEEDRVTSSTLVREQLARCGTTDLLHPSVLKALLSRGYYVNNNTEPSCTVARAAEERDQEG